MPSGWRWAVLPKRLLDDDDRSLSLSLAERGLLFSCYLICDKNGRFPASGRAFCRLAAVNGDGLAILDKLHGLGLVTLYDVGQASYGELERYAEDRPAGHPPSATVRMASRWDPEAIRMRSGRHPA
jgi:hypothetical protein